MFLGGIPVKKYPVSSCAYDWIRIQRDLNMAGMNILFLTCPDILVQNGWSDFGWVPLCPFWVQNVPRDLRMSGLLQSSRLAITETYPHWCHFLTKERHNYHKHSINYLDWLGKVPQIKFGNLLGRAFYIPFTWDKLKRLFTGPPPS